MTWYHLVIVATIVVLPIVMVLFAEKLGWVRNILLALAILLLLALDWAAFHDIAKGTEPHYGMEYAVLAASLAVFAFLVARRLGRRAMN